MISFYLAIKDLLPDIITQLGPNQLHLLKDLAMKRADQINEAANEEEEEIPGLVNQNFEDVSKKEA